MRRTSPPIQLLATAATDASTSTAAASVMSSRPSHRGRRRGFSGRSYSSGREQFVTGEEHFRSVRDANFGYRRGDKANFANQTQQHHHQNPLFNPSPQQPPSPHQQNPQFRHPRPPFRPLLHHNKQAYRPSQQHRSRPPDFRGWELAKAPPPPPDCERFIVLSYNILADYLALDHRHKLYFHIPRHMLDWQWRKRNLIFELGLWSADIMCLQEVDRFHDLEEELKLKGYSGVWKMRTGNAVDGCAIFWQTARFKLVYEECIEFNKLGLRDNVAQICVLEFINQNGSLPSSWTGSSKIVVCNIHVLYNPNRGEIKLGQVRLLLDRAKAVSELWNNAPVVICGDFNCTPKSPLYNFISEQKLDLSGIDRDKVSGQASAVIRTPRLCSPYSSERSANGSVQTTSIEGDNEVNIEQNRSLLDMQNPRNMGSSSENQYAHIVSDVSDESGINVQRGKERDAHAGRDTQETVVEDSKIFGKVVSIKEEPNASNREARLPNNHVNEGIHDVKPNTSSALEAVHTDTTCTGQIPDAISSSNQESLSKNSNLHVPEGKKHMELDCSRTSQEDNQSSKVKIVLESIDLLNEDISSTEPSIQTSVSDTFEVCHPGYRESPSYEPIVNDQMNSLSTSDLIAKSQQSTSVDFPLDEKLEKLFLDDINKSIEYNKNICKDDNAFISALHNAEGVILDLGSSIKSDIKKSSQLDELDSASNNFLLPAESNGVEDDLPPSLTSKSIDAVKTTYNPSLWTPIETETATGNAECTFLEHLLPLRSTYTEAMDCSETRDPHGEPLVTSYNRCFLGTVDYIWRSEGLQTARVLAPIPKQAIEWTPGFPTKKWGSDHIALASELAFLKGGADISGDA